MSNDSDITKSDETPLAVDASSEPMVLSYATRNTETAIEPNEYAAKCLAQGVPLWKVADSFSNREKAIQFFAHWMEERYSFLTAGESCFQCKSPASWIASVTWQTILRPKSWTWRALNHMAEYQTHHALCDKCAKRMRRFPELQQFQNWQARQTQNPIAYMYWPGFFIVVCMLLERFGPASMSRLFFVLYLILAMVMIVGTWLWYRLPPSSIRKMRNHRNRLKCWEVVPR